MKKTSTKNGFTVTAYQGDATTLLAFSLDEKKTENLAGFTIAYVTPKGKSFFLSNRLSFKNKITNDTDPSARMYETSDTAPFQKFRWVHVPGSLNQKLNQTEFGDYIYKVTPRYFNRGKLKDLDSSLTVSVTIAVEPFEKKNFQLGFARGFMASQAYVHRFGKNRNIRPNDKDLTYNIEKKAGVSPKGIDYTFEDQYLWMGFTAREKLLGFIDEVLNDPRMSLDVFGYDLNEPTICEGFLQLAKEGRIRILLDNAGLHVNSDSRTRPDTFENMFEEEFNRIKKGKAEIVRAHFGRFAHNKVMVQKRNGKAVSVLTGSTNFSTNGLYINANHVIIMNSPAAATLYQKVFDQSFTEEGRKGIRAFNLNNQNNEIKDDSLPATSVTFSPHSETKALEIISNVTKAVQKAEDSVFFAVMELKGSGEIIDELKQLQRDTGIFSYGVTDTTAGIKLYKPNEEGGILVTGKKIQSKLPPPFEEEIKPGGHEIHHKFIVLDFNSNNPLVFCGSSNLAEGGEKANSDNLICIQDEDVATAFAIEAIRLVDHYHFRDAMLNADNTKPLLLDVTNQWCHKYYDPQDMYFRDRNLMCPQKLIGNTKLKAKGGVKMKRPVKSKVRK